LAATLGGTQSLHTNGFDEALALPTAEAATLALRTQQVVGYESGVAQTVDPLAGSWYVEALTDEVERQAMALVEKVDALGGAVAAIAQGFFQEEIARSAYAHQLRVESGETVVVGVNRFGDGQEPPVIPTPDFTALETDQVARLTAVKGRRNAAEVQARLSALNDAARGGAGGTRPALMPLIIDAVRARASVGEISDCLRGAWGEYRAS
ncbi:MAG: methylmalonyl-CoA mutase, partial [Gemmatimonadetes bacterium]|nr:methylmalonyl-CoA mutase [Gemmatimonadota bacterium]